MSDLVYTFTFPRRALGLDVVITDNSGQTVSIADDPTLALTADNGNAYIELSLPAENAPYSAAVSSSRVGAFSTEGQVALAESIADAPGAAETAYLIATGVSGVTDGGFVTGANFVADDRYGALPEWVTLVAGDPVLGADAGGCVASARVLADCDFTATTPPDAPDQVGAYFQMKRNATVIVASSETATYVDGDGENVQSVEVPAAGAFVFGGTITVEPGADGGAVVDGDATFTIAVNITRLAPAPTLPA